MRELQREFALRQFADEIFEIFRELIVARIRDELVQVTGDRADIFRDAPFIVVENADEFFCRVRDVVHRFKRNAVRQRGVAENTDDLFIRTAFVARRRHAERGRKRRARVTRTERIVFAFRAERKTVQAVRLANRAKTIFASRQNFVNVNLMAHVPDKFVLRRGENFVQRNGKLDDAEIRTEMAAAFGETFD